MTLSSKFFLIAFTLLAFLAGGFAASASAASAPAAGCQVDDFFQSTPTQCVNVKVLADNPSNQSATKSSCAQTSIGPQYQPAPGAGNPFVTLKVFSAVICRVVEMTRDIAGQMWCGISDGLKQPLSYLITLYIVCLAILYAVGVIPPSGPELLKTILKIALVWGFATDGELAIKFGYDFFMSVATDGISMVLTSVSPAGATVTPGLIFDSMDEIFSSIYFSSAPAEDSKEALSIFGGFAALSSAVPLGTTLGAFMVMTVFYSLFVFVKAVISYLFAITGITFLCAIMPLFLAMALFKTTSGMFWGWLGSLVSLSLQPVILFAFLILIQSHLKTSLDDLACLIQQRVHVSDSKNTICNGALCSLINPNRYQLTQGPCKPGDTILTNPDCKYLDPYKQWDYAQDFLNDTMVPIISALVLLVMTNAFLAYIPEIAQTLSNGMMGYAVPSLGSSAGTGGSYYVRRGALDAGDSIMAKFNQTGGRWKDANGEDAGFLRRKTTTDPITGEKKYSEEEEFNYQAMIDMVQGSAQTQMGDMGMNRFNRSATPGKEVYYGYGGNTGKSPGSGTVFDEPESVDSTGKNPDGSLKTTP